MLNTEKWYHRLKLATLRSYALLLVFVLLSIILSLNIFSYIQNTRQLSISRGVSEVRMPLSLRAQDILIGLSRASTAQRGYLLTGEQAFVEERAAVWKDIVWPSLEILIALKPSLQINENVERITKLELLIPQYQELQEQIDQQQTRFIDKLKNTTYVNDSLAGKRALAEIKQEKANRSAINNLVSTRVLPLQKEINEAIRPLIQTQEDVLRANVEEIAEGIEVNRAIFFIFSLVGTVLAIVITFVFLKKLKKSVAKPTHLLEQLAQGVLVEDVGETKDELNNVMQAGSRLSTNLSAASQFAKAIGEGEFDTEFTLASEHDTLGNALVHMRDRLQEVATEDKKRSWATSGLAQISDILRVDDQKSSNMYLNIIRFVVNYLGANQGGLFLATEDNGEDTTSLKLVACYAYERQKFLKKTVGLGEGLLGQAFLEQKAIFLTEVPENYVQITSGLGKASPRCVLISPLKVNDHVSGVLEIVSFEVLADYQVEFIERLSETIAAAISGIRVAERTRTLLDETQSQAEMVRSQEEEMRQNNEELQAIQEEMHRKAQEIEEKNKRMEGILNATPDAIITTDESLKINSANTACEDLFGYSDQELQDKPLSTVVTSGLDVEDITTVEETLGSRKDGESITLATRIRSVALDNSKIFTIILRDISEQVELEAQLKQRLVESKNQEEELKQNLEKLNTIQESLAQKNEEIERVRTIEKERAEQQIAARKKMMEKAVSKFKAREKELLDQLAEKG